MNFDPAEIASCKAFEKRYVLGRKRWYDGPYGSWEAFDRVLEREVVLNMAWAYTRAPQFLRAANLSASLQDPGFLPVYDLGILGGTTPFYTTPPVRGEPLDQLLRGYPGDGAPTGGSFPLRSLVGAVRDACRALEYAHRRGLLHLDLHPECLLIGGDYHVVLDVSDWSEIGDRGTDEAGSSPRLVRPAYMSPEQVNEAGPGVGPATDVFGLGGLLHVVLFGTPPNHLPGMTGVTVGVVIGAIAGRAFEPRRPGPLRQGIRSEVAGRLDGLVGICLKALAYEPEGRYPTAEALAEDLEGWLEGR